MMAFQFLLSLSADRPVSRDATMWRSMPVFLLLLLSYLIEGSWAEHLLHSFPGQVGAGNYTYYKLSREGTVRLVLTSRRGDADLYVSDLTLKPDYENYELQSVTCGQDEVLVPSDFKRPVGVGVYGHPSHEKSDFLLSVYVDSIGSSSFQHSSQPYHPSTKFADGKEEEDSILWTIFVGILKIIVDILV